MNRCLQLAELGAGKVAPNPMVGALLVYNNKIIGEGYHEQYGGPHAEVNCINSVSDQNKPFIASATIYVSLEPCAHFGQTPPCADLIIKHKIPHVVIAAKDPYEKVNGSGIQKLKDAGVEVTVAVLEKEAQELNKRFFTFHNKKRPFIILKWAQTNDGFIAKPGFEKIAISNDYSNRFTHRLRTTEAAIMVGFNTALYDNPSLTARFWPGKNPARILIDKQLKLPVDAAVFNKDAPVIIINNVKDGVEGQLRFIKLKEENDLLQQLMIILVSLNINSLIVEGGAKLMNSFITQGLWDEAYVITNSNLNIAEGIKSPDFSEEKKGIFTGNLSHQIACYKNY